MILQGCKQLVHLDVRECSGFHADDAKILRLASHIPAFMCEGYPLFPELDAPIDFSFDPNDFGYDFDFDDL